MTISSKVTGYKRTVGFVLAQVVSTNLLLYDSTHQARIEGHVRYWDRVSIPQSDIDQEYRKSPLVQMATPYREYDNFLSFDLATQVEELTPCLEIRLPKKGETANLNQNKVLQLICQ